MKLHQKISSTKLTQLICKNKVADFGVYTGAVDSTNTDAFDENKGWKSARRWQRKSWIFVGIYTPEVSIGFAMVDAGYLGKAFCYVHFNDGSAALENGIDKPFGFDANFEGNLDSTWQLGNYKISPLGNQQYHLQYAGKKFELNIEFSDQANGLSFVCPSEQNSKRPFHFTYKNALLPMQVHLKQGKQQKSYTDVLGSLDFSKGYPPRHTTWNWLSFTGETSDGIAVGINLVNGFNDNMENAIWIGDDVQLLGEVQFDYQAPLAQSDWKVSNQTDSLLLTLAPKGSRKENINLQLLRSKFIQVFGEINGKVKINNEWVIITGYGVMEEHESFW